MNIANENIVQQQVAMIERKRQLEAAADVRVQRDAAAAKLAFTNAEQVMIQEHARERCSVSSICIINVYRERGCL